MLKICFYLFSHKHLVTHSIICFFHKLNLLSLYRLVVWRKVMTLNTSKQTVLICYSTEHDV